MPSPILDKQSLPSTSREHGCWAFRARPPCHRQGCPRKLELHDCKGSYCEKGKTKEQEWVACKSVRWGRPMGDKVYGISYGCWVVGMARPWSTGWAVKAHSAQQSPIAMHRLADAVEQQTTMRYAKMRCGSLSKAYLTGTRSRNRIKSNVSARKPRSLSGAYPYIVPQRVTRP